MSTPDLRAEWHMAENARAKKEKEEAAAKGRAAAEEARPENRLARMARDVYARLNGQTASVTPASAAATTRSHADGLAQMAERTYAALNAARQE